MMGMFGTKYNKKIPALPVVLKLNCLILHYNCVP